MTGTVPLLFDSVSANTGDAAIGIAGQQVLARMGVASDFISPFAPPAGVPTIVGGGELIREPGDAFYDKFRLPGAHILNAAGVWTGATDLEYLKDYREVSARTAREAEVLSGVRPDVRVVPCTTTLLESEHYAIPGAEEGEPLVGIHVAPHALRFMDDIAAVIDSIPHRKVLIPFTHYINDQSFMNALPIDRTDVIPLGILKPLEIHAVLRQMKYVMVTSLHATIFSYTQNVPFAVIAQRKVGYYFGDRGLSDHVVADQASLVAHLDRLENDPPDYSALVAKDKAAVSEAYERYLPALAAGEGSVEWAPSRRTETEQVTIQEILIEQLQRVVRDRDLSIAVVEHRRRSAEVSLTRLRNKRRNRWARKVGVLLVRLRRLAPRALK